MRREIVIAISLLMGLVVGVLLWNRASGLVPISSSRMREQVQTPTPAPEPLPDIAASPLILTYHDVSPDAVGPYNITNARFAQDMASLHAAGWTTISSGEYLAWLRGESDLPENSVLLTFDDGTAGSWIYVEPILRQYKAKATLFLTTGWLGEGPYYLTWPEVRALHDTGRWDVQAHTHLGHRFVRVNDAAGEQPFMINRIWRNGRLETMSQFKVRVLKDLRTSIRHIEGRGYPRPQMFAYPFAAYLEPTNDSKAAALARAEVERLFEAVLTADVAIIDPDRPDPSDIPRLGVTMPLSLPELFAVQEPKVQAASE
jgi:poly-beta-1,6-N-acetyl-D-glucosamine N-deacetylase